ncbi:unnamed protein product [Cylindrotheca closterium]|uniref:Uncharacterized protein n=1 Tax=Cylindrotheca closterium TaxID=2856 RepID=A0AAD2FEG2_9STRA|nr:unnamed protein product [Cylindrotheca closterium]
MKSFFKTKKKSNKGYYKSSENYHGQSVKIVDALKDGIVADEEADWLMENERHNPYQPYKTTPPRAEGQAREDIFKPELLIRTQQEEAEEEKIPEKEPVTEPLNETMESSFSDTDEGPVQEDAVPQDLFDSKETAELEETFQASFFSDLYSVASGIPGLEVSEDKQKAMDEIDELVEEYNEHVTDDDTADEDNIGFFGLDDSGDEGLVGDLDESSSSRSDYSTSSGEDGFTEQQQQQQELPTKTSTVIPSSQEEKKEEKTEISQPSSRDASSKTGSTNRDASFKFDKFDVGSGAMEAHEEVGLFAGMSLKQMFWDDLDESEVDEDDVDSDDYDMDDFSDKEDPNFTQEVTQDEAAQEVTQEEVNQEVTQEVNQYFESTDPIDQADFDEHVMSTEIIETEFSVRTTEEDPPATTVAIEESVDFDVDDTMENQNDSQTIEPMVLLERFAGKGFEKPEEDQEPGKVHPKATAVRKKNKPFRFGGFSGRKNSGVKKNTVAPKEAEKNLVRSTSKQETATKATSPLRKPRVTTDKAKTEAASIFEPEVPTSPSVTTTVEASTESRPSHTEPRPELEPSQTQATRAIGATSVPAPATKIEIVEKPLQEKEDEQQSELAAFSAMMQDVYQFTFGNFPQIKKQYHKSPKEIWAEPAVDRGFETCHSYVGGEPYIQKAISHDEQNNQVSSISNELPVEAAATTPSNKVSTGSNKDGVGENDTPATTPASSAGSLSQTADDKAVPESPKIEEGYEVRPGQASEEIHEVASGIGFEFSQKIHTIFRTTNSKGKKQSKKSKSSWFGRKKSAKPKTTKQ